MQYQLSRVVIGPFLRAIGRLKVVGIENIPPTGPAILASNHLSFIDSMYLPLMIDRPVVFPAKAEYFAARARSAGCGPPTCGPTNQLTMDRGGARSAQATLEAAVDCRERGSFSGSTRRGLGRRTVGSTGVGPESAGWR